jgi:hypothetical protein
MATKKRKQTGKTNPRTRTNKPRRSRFDKIGAIYQLKVTLEGSDPPIWRRVQVPDLTLGELHDVLQVIMGWDDYHLHQFLVGDEYYAPPSADEMDWGMEAKDEDAIRLSQIAAMGRKGRFIYEYDFGNSWEHEIILEQTTEPEASVEYPRCLEGARACPPEDIGGIWGYAEFLEAIGDPKHEDHDGTKEWVGENFDPAQFDLEAVNRGLSRL